MKKQLKYWVWAVVLLGAWACNKSEEDKGKPLVTVFGKSLYASDIEGIVSKDVSVKDSIMLVNSYIENWAKEQLMFAIAEQNIPDDLNVNKLVEDYRRSLIRHTYEKKLVEQRLDSAITETEIQAYYEEAKDQYKLEETVVQGFFIKIIDDAPNQDSLSQWWKMKTDTDLEKLVEYARSYADRFLLKEEIWVSSDYLAAEYPISSFNDGSLSDGVQFKQKKEGYVYFLKINKVIKKGNTAPLDYVREKIIRIILQKRRLDLLETVTEELYKRELEKGNVKIL